MNNNHKSIKETFSNIHPSDECIERIFDMTKKKKQTGLIMKRAASAVLAAAIIVGGGFGINSLSGKNNDRFISSAGYSIGGIMTVEAKEPLRPGNVSADNGYDMGYRIYTKDITGLSDKEIEKEKVAMAELYLCSGDLEGRHTGEISDKFTVDDTIKNTVHIKNNVIYATERGYAEQAITLCGIDDPSTVKEIRINNESDYGYPIMEANDLYYTENSDGKFIYDNIGVDTSKTSIKGHNISLSGERYLQCRRIENPEAAVYSKEYLDKSSPLYGKELATGRVFSFIYEFSDEFYDMLGDNPNYDFTKYNDTIYVTVEFKDGTVATNTLNVTLDKNGMLFCSCSDYSIK